MLWNEDVGANLWVSACVVMDSEFSHGVEVQETLRFRQQGGKTGLFIAILLTLIRFETIWSKSKRFTVSGGSQNSYALKPLRSSTDALGL
jgi:hypothetical protein